MNDPPNSPMNETNEKSKPNITIDRWDKRA